jgi:hypothetical protein
LGDVGFLLTQVKAEFGRTQEALSGLLANLR